jgi:hypothetical protein
MIRINCAQSHQLHLESAQKESMRCLDFVVERDKAVEQVGMLVKKRPQSKSAQKLLDSVSHD